MATASPWRSIYLRKDGEPRSQTLFCHGRFNKNRIALLSTQLFLFFNKVDANARLGTVMVVILSAWPESLIEAYFLLEW